VELCHVHVKLASCRFPVFILETWVEGLLILAPTGFRPQSLFWGYFKLAGRHGNGKSWFVSLIIFPVNDNFAGSGG
jgi:hypothetical protein